MQAISISQKQLHVIDCNPPIPADDEVLIKVHASGMNRADYLQMQGRYPAPEGASPLPGLEVAGEIVALGKNTTSRWKIGERVAALMSGGGYAEYATAHSGLCLHIPNHISYTQAAACPEAMFTIQNNVFLLGNLQKGENILIHGGTSGIGTFAIQIANAFGALVYTTTSSDEKVKFCEHLGANLAINRTQHDYTQILKSTPINLVLSLGGGDDITRDQTLMCLDARHVSIAYPNGATASINIPLMMQNRHIFTGSTLRARPLPEKIALCLALRETLWPMLINTQLEPVIDRTFPLKDAAQAMDYFTSGQHKGKVILTNC